MSLTNDDWKAIERLIARLQGRPAKFSEMDMVLTSFYREGLDNCFSLTISSKSCAISTTMSQLLDDYPAVFSIVLKDSQTCMLRIRTLHMHKYKAISEDLKQIGGSIQMQGSNFHLTLP